MSAGWDDVADRVVARTAELADTDLTTQLRATLIALGTVVDVEDYAPPVGVPVDLDVQR